MLRHVPEFSGPWSTSNMCMREDLKLYTGKCYKDMGKHLKILLPFYKLSKIWLLFAHVLNKIQKVVDNGPENPGTACEKIQECACAVFIDCHNNGLGY